MIEDFDYFSLAKITRKKSTNLLRLRETVISSLKDRKKHW